MRLCIGKLRQLPVALNIAAVKDYQSRVTYAKGQLKDASRHLSYAFIEFEPPFLQVFPGHFVRKGNFLCKKENPLSPSSFSATDEG